MAKNMDYKRSLNVNEVMKITGLSRSLIYQYMKQNKFPRGRRVIGKLAAEWDANEIDQWMQLRQAGVSTDNVASRISALEGAITFLVSQIATLNMRIDSIERRLDQIERKSC
jgi:predicted DNA-binding transcriptional regulator AlpA